MFDNLSENDEVIAYLPIAWVGDHVFSYAQSYVAGFASHCPEAAETVVEDRREIGTTYAFAPPRVYENLHHAHAWCAWRTPAGSSATCSITSSLSRANGARKSSTERACRSARG